MKHFEYERPAVYVYYSSEIEEISVFFFFLYGIEEEGIPYEIRPQMESGAYELSYKAARDSRLGVGIGIHICGEVTMTINKLEKEKPLFTADLFSNQDILRNLGANAGRLVKGIAFK